MDRLYIGLEADRLAVASILVKNKYKVCQGSERRGAGKSYDYFLEYEPGPGQVKTPAGKGTARNES